MSISFGQANDKGTRERQEDYSKLLETHSNHLMVLADGMGGYAGGSEASESVTKEFIRFFTQRETEYNETIPILLENATFSANSHLAQIRYTGTHTNMGSTLVALVMRGNHAWWVSVGDSLLYLWRNGKLHKLNAVHNYHQDLRQKVILKEITAEQARHDPEKEGLTSALMGRRLKHIDVSHFGLELHNNDLLILASDGLETLSFQQAEKIITQHNTSHPDAIANALINQVLAANNPHQDNVTVQVAKIEGIRSQQQLSPSIPLPVTPPLPRKTRFSRVIIPVLGTIFAFLALATIIYLLPSPNSPLTKTLESTSIDSVGLSQKQLSTFKEKLDKSCNDDFKRYHMKETTKTCSYHPVNYIGEQEEICPPLESEVIQRFCKEMVSEIKVPEKEKKSNAATDNSLLNRVSSWLSGNDS